LYGVSDDFLDTILSFFVEETIMAARLSHVKTFICLNMIAPKFFFHNMNILFEKNLTKYFLTKKFCFGNKLF